MLPLLLLPLVLLPLVLLPLVLLPLLLLPLVRSYSSSSCVLRLGVLLLHPYRVNKPLRLVSLASAQDAVMLNLNSTRATKKKFEKI